MSMAPDPAPEAAARRSSRLRFFLAAHLLAVLALYALALAIGGGLGAMPMPPDLPVRAAMRAAPGPQHAPATAATQAAAPARTAVDLAGAAAPDVAAPWAQGAAAAARRE